MIDIDAQSGNGAKGARDEAIGRGEGVHRHACTLFNGRADEFRVLLPSQVWCTCADGPVEFLNRRWLEYTGLSLEEDYFGVTLGELQQWHRLIHHDDLPTEFSCQTERSDITTRLATPS
jgi:PAS domain-containing protein